MIVDYLQVDFSVGVGVGELDLHGEPLLLDDVHADSFLAGLLVGQGSEVESHLCVRCEVAKVLIQDGLVFRNFLGHPMVDLKEVIHDNPHRALSSKHIFF